MLIANVLILFDLTHTLRKKTSKILGKDKSGFGQIKTVV